MHESCGIFGIYAPGVDVARVTFFALYALQHRGQESAGIATAEGNKVYIHTDMGLVSHVFNEEELARLTGDIAIGHNRYSTTGSSAPCNAQPVLVGTTDTRIALGHNGNITNSMTLRTELEEKGFIFNASTDSEVIANLILSAPEKEMEARIKYAMRRMQGAYSLVLLANDKLYGVRDPMGVRPLCLGTFDTGWVLASETCGLDHIGAQYVREVEPGEIVTIDSSGVRSTRIESTKKALCVFEYIYFARPDSLLNGRLIYSTREKMGAILSREYPVEADIAMGIPDSATAAGIGYARASGIPYHEGLLKNRYVGRTFIEPDQRLRELGVRLKFNPLTEAISGKRLVVVDDSIVRGTTTPRVINLLRKAGAREVHMRICAPPIRYPCFFGVDMATRWELIAAQKSVSQIRDIIGADSLGYISMEGLIEAVGLPREELCMACFTGDYPTPVQLEMDKLQLETLPFDSIRSFGEIQT
ncbi:MAG: amidophosphoribosyltransferase [Dehalococcoidia bacterium]|nr:amidophosphoribosyltransferase [Dehalococcoidia bacterium]